MILFDIVDNGDALVIGDIMLQHSNHLQILDDTMLQIKDDKITKTFQFISYSSCGELRPKLMAVPPTSRTFTWLYSANRPKETPYQLNLSGETLCVKMFSMSQALLSVDLVAKLEVVA